MSCDLGRAEVQVHAVVVAGDGVNVETAEPVNLQLEGQSWFKMRGREGEREDEGQRYDIIKK